MPLIKDDVEMVGELRLPLGGLNGYVNVRGKQGRKKDKYQGYTPNKNRRTKPCAACTHRRLLGP